MSPFLSRAKKIKFIIKDHFLSGLLFLGPILIVAVVFHWIFGGLVSWIEEVPLHFIFSKADQEILGIVRFLVVVGIVIVGIFLISFIGFFSRLYFGKKALVWIREGIERIPFFGAIYASLDQLFKAISNQGGEQFNRVVYIEYPRKEMWTIAFVTGKSNMKGFLPGYLNVFVPAVPVPTSGFYVMVKESEVMESGLRVDEAFKIILSLGTAANHE